MLTRAARMYRVSTWGRFAGEHPSLAAFGAALLVRAPAYLATVRADGSPRVHPVTPVIGDERLFLFMEPTSPKRRDLLAEPRYAMHSAVPDDAGTGGEFHLRGTARFVDDDRLRAEAVRAARYSPHDRYVLFEFDITTARCNGYGDVELPEPRTWTG